MLAGLNSVQRFLEGARVTQGRNRRLQAALGFAIVRLRFGNDRKHQPNQMVKLTRPAEEILRRSKQGVDEKRETLHNLIPLLLTNTTLRTVQQGSTEHWFFNNQQSISVGV